MIDKTNDPELRAYIERERIRRRQEAASCGAYRPYKPAGAEVTLKVPKVKSAEIPEDAAEIPEASAENDDIFLLLQEFKKTNNYLNLIHRELKNINKKLDKRR